MVRLIVMIWVGLWAALPVAAQTRAVAPEELTLTVTQETLSATPYRQEMILLTIHGIYKRHITLEKLQQPDLKGFNWMQLGEDHWYDSMIAGKTVKNMRRRMALFPEVTGDLEIGPFRHRLTLLDEQNKWFEHEVLSDPVTITVDPEPAGADWWFPVRRLKVEDNWSNTPDQLAPGAGVLRIVRVSALGASPDMIPPMPELKSPSALIFAHPEKRLVDLTARGPEAIAFWRWTVTPTNGHAAILEPIEFSYFDTINRKTRKVVITAQRVAFEETATKEAQAAAPPPEPATQHPGLLGAVGVLVVLAVVLLNVRGRVLTATPILGWIRRHRLAYQLRRAAARGDGSALRRSARTLDGLYTPSPARRVLLADLDSHLFGSGDSDWDAKTFARSYLASLTTPLGEEVPISEGFRPST